MATLRQPQDELVDLFARSLSLAIQNPSTPNQQFLFDSDSKGAITYASQHYTHSAHYVQPSSDSIEAILWQHSINPSYLFPCQLDLFTTADLDLRLRLLELWRTAPIRSTDMDAIRYRYGELTSTNLLQEEVLARLRLERDVAELNVVAAHKSPEAEPYMVSGYAGASSNSPSKTMEDQYGAWMAAREFERIQEIHRQVEGARPVSAGGHAMDDEMVA
ncbi:hypothetical protein ANO11243_072110 [Dothideomycetidae sp. 11243]|nr:hypothetical protein ANO11243_072110 [fungal sp. No.11243]